MIFSKPHNNTYFGIPLANFICLLLCIATLAVYWQVKDHGFVWDDFDYVVENPSIQDGLTLKSLSWSFTSAHSSNWHPVTWLSHALDIHLFGMTPGNHHMTNVLFHIANTLLLFFVLSRMTHTVWRSIFVAALFALHPLHVESVAWVAERKDVLSTFFWMLTMWGYVRYVENPGATRYLIIVLTFILGLMSKSMLVTLPFVLLLLDYWPLKRLRPGLSGIRRLVLEKIPLILLSAASGIITCFAQKAGGSIESLSMHPLADRISNALVSYSDYIIKMVWPFNLSVIYPYPQMLPWWQVSGACLFLISVSFLTFRVAKQHPYIVTGWLWYMGTLVPVIGLVQVGSQAMADRYTYVPLTGLFIIISWGGAELVERWRYKTAGLAMATTAVISILAVTTFLQTLYWADGISLFRHTLQTTTDNSVAHYNLGLVFLKQNRTSDAIKHFHEVLRINPGDEEAHYNLGIILSNQGRMNEGAFFFSQALRINPGFAEAYYNLGLIFAKQEKLDKAIIRFSQALRLNPNDANAFYNIGLVFAKQGRHKKARFCYSEALRIDPGHAEAHNSMGVALVKRGRIAEAIGHFSQALNIDPTDTKAQLNLENALSLQGRTIINGRKPSL